MTHTSFLTQYSLAGQSRHEVAEPAPTRTYWPMSSTWRTLQ